MCWSVRSASPVRHLRARTRWKSARESVYLCTPPFGLSLSDRQVEEWSKKNKSSRSDLCRSKRLPCACVLPCVQDECWDIRRRLLWLSPRLRWRRIPQWRPRWRWPCHWRPRWSQFNIGNLGLSGHVFRFPAVQSVSLYSGCSYGVVASSLGGLHDLVLVSVVTPFVRRSDVNPFPLAIMSNSSMSECV